MAIDHEARARKAWPYLVARASKAQPPFSYGELSAKLGFHHRAAQWFLGVIQTQCRAQRLPPLQSLVVNCKTRLPGSGYYGSQRTHAAHARALALVYSEKWSKKAPF